MSDLEHVAIEAAFQHSQTVSWANHDKHTAAVLCAMHVAVLCKTGNSGPSGSALGICLAFMALALPALVSLAAPSWYRAGSHRCWVVAVTRLGTAFFLIKASELAATGAFAAVTNMAQALCKVLGGCRVVPLVIMAHAFPLPVQWLMWVQLAGLARAAVESREYLCRVPQLASPVVKQLVLRMAGVTSRAGSLGGAFGFLPPDWATQVDAVQPSEWCFLLAFWLQLTVGYVLPLLLRWLLTERARRAFYAARCRRRSCEICIGIHGIGLLGTYLASAGIYVLLAVGTWDVLFANQLAAHVGVQSQGPGGQALLSSGAQNTYT